MEKQESKVRGKREGAALSEDKFELRFVGPTLIDPMLGLPTDTRNSPQPWSLHFVLPPITIHDSAFTIVLNDAPHQPPGP